LDSQYSYNFYGSWADAVREVYGSSSLTDKDQEVLTEIGIALGKTDLSNQRGFFSQVYERLGQQINEAVEDRRIKGKLYQTILSAQGVLTVIVLL
jgi:stage III sporulation protein AB